MVYYQYEQKSRQYLISGSVVTKKAVALLALLFIFVSLFPLVTAADPVGFNSVVDLELTVCKGVNSAGEPIEFDGSAIQRDASNVLYFTYTVKENCTLASGVPYTFPITGPLVDFTDEFEIKYGNLLIADGTVSTAGEVSLTFTGNLDPSERDGVFFFSAKFNPDEIPNGGLQTLTMGVGSTTPYTPTYNFAVDEVTASATPVKTNEPVSAGDPPITNPRQRKWFVKVTPSIQNATANLSTPSDPNGTSDAKFNSWTITDVMEEKTAGGITVSSLELTPTGSGAALAWEEKTDAQNKKTVEITCGFPTNMPMDGATEYTLSYITEFTNAEIAARLKSGTAEFKNKASSDFEFPQYKKSAEDDATKGKAVLDTPEEKTENSNESTASIAGGSLTKQAFIENEGEQIWVLRIENTLNYAGAQLNDKLPKSIDIITDTTDGMLKVFSGSSPGKDKLPVYDEKSPDYPSYSYAANADGSHNLTIHLATGTAEQLFCYETKVIPANYQAGTIKNHVDFTWDGTGPGRQIIASKDATVDPGGYYMTKSGDYDPATHEVTWEVYVDRTNLSDVYFIDTIPAGQSYVANSIETINASGTAFEDGGTKTSFSGSGPTVMTVDFSSVTQTWNTSVPVFRYKTRLDDSENGLWALNTDPAHIPNVNNSVIIRANGMPSEGYKLTVHEPVVSTVLEKVCTSAEYDPVDKTINWQLTVNKNEMTMTNPTVVDTLPPGWSFVTAQLAVTQDGNTVTPVAVVYSTDAAAGAVMRIELPDMTQGSATAKPYVIAYKTKLTDPSKLQRNDEWYAENTAVLTAVEMPDGGQSVTARKAIDLPMLKKEATNAATAKNDGFISWRVIINQGLTTISAPRGSASLTLIDPLAKEDLALDTDSVKLYSMKMESGTLREDALLTCGRDYNFSYDSSAGKIRIDFKKKSINTAFKLTFDTDFVQIKDGSYSNSISFEGFDAAVQTGESDPVPMNFSGGRTSPRFTYGSVRVIKTDPLGVPLQGAEFTLIKNGAVGGLTAVTDANGVAEFINVPTGAVYTLTEIKAPPGYSRPAAHSWSVNVQTTATIERTVINTKTPLSQSGRANPNTGG